MENIAFTRGPENLYHALQW